MKLKRPRAPVKVIVMEKSYSSTPFHLSTPMRFWLVGIPARISSKWFSQCGGKDNVMLTVSITHPRRTCQVCHKKSTSLNVFSNKTSLQLAKST